MIENCVYFNKMALASQAATIRGGKVEIFLFTHQNELKFRLSLLSFPGNSSVEPQTTKLY